MKTKQTKQTLSLALALSAVATLFAGTTSAAPPTDKRPRTECADADCREDVLAAKKATAPYHDVSAAEADGYFSTFECVAVPGLGGMGIHYVNPSLMDLSVDPAKPEVLLFLPVDGGYQLLGAEYVAAVLSNGRPWFGDASTPPPTIDNPSPIIFGRSMDGPMAGHEPGQPWHYELHAWIWQMNPVSTFAPFNPRIQCP